MTIAARQRRGFALLAVLWTMALLAVIVTRIAAEAHTETRIAVNLRDAAQMEAAADGAVNMAAFRILDRSEHHLDPHTMPGPHLFTEGGTEVEVWLRDESDLIDINTASADMLAAALMIAGAEAPKAAAVAQSLVLWRTEPVLPPQALPGRAYGVPGEAFRTLEELTLVPGMAPELFGKLAPHLTLYSGEPPFIGTQDALAAPTLRQMHLQTGYDPPPRKMNAPIVVRILATARGRNEASFTRTAILRLDPATPNAALAVLQWN